MMKRLLKTLSYELADDEAILTFVCGITALMVLIGLAAAGIVFLHEMVYSVGLQTYLKVYSF